jgi:dihydrofolate reductase
MRRIISQLFVLLDGVMKAPEEWHFPYYDNWMAEVVAEQIDGADILLLGPATYQIFVGSWPQRGGEVPSATRINAMPKLVVSTTLTSVAWQNTTVIAGDVPEELAKIKEQPGRNVTVSGGPTLVRSLQRNCLLDKLQLLVHPLVRGHGRRWLEDGVAQPLELIGSRRRALRSDRARGTFLPGHHRPSPAGRSAARSPTWAHPAMRCGTRRLASGSTGGS